MELAIRNLENTDFPVLNGQGETWGFQTKRPGLLEWLMKFRPEHRLSLVAVLDGKIVGFYVNIPSLFQVGGKTLTVFGGTVGVHPGYRGEPHNIFKLLVKAVHEEIGKRGGMIYGFPNEGLISYYNRKVQIRTLKPVPRYVRGMGRVSPAGLFPLKLRLLLRGAGCVGRIHSFDERFNGLWEAVSRTDKIMIVRNAEYLNWRFFEVPGEENAVFAEQGKDRIAGYAVVTVSDKKGIRTGSVSDLFDIRRPHVTKNLLLKALGYFREKGASRAEFYVLDDYYERELVSLGFVRADPPGQGHLLHVKSYSLEVDGDYFHDPRNWFLTRADMLYA